MRNKVLTDLRLAQRIQARLAQRRSPTLSLPLREWQELERSAKRLDLSRARGWQHAERVVQVELQQRVRLLGARLEDLGSKLRSPPTSPPSLKDLLADLAALRGEFKDVTATSETLSVTTDAIELEGTDLGRYQIVLAWNRLRCEETPFKIEALDDQAATQDPSISHPHVSGGSLCMGDGRLAIRQALADGRLLDFFMLVRQVLRTYNPDGAYVKLRDWEGERCDACGDHAAAEDMNYCERCHTDACEACSGYCAHCEETHCDSCLKTCYACDASACTRGTTTCPDCDETFCRGCLTDGRCESCHEENQHNVEAEQAALAEEDAEPVAETSASPLHPMGVVQADLPA